ncbi:MAG: c-type cytochrome [Pseudomonadota bacterium]|nr:c-type cytochrome [Pseudomonadota bacterium]
MRHAVIIAAMMLLLASCSRDQEPEDPASEAPPPSPPDLTAGESLAPPCAGCHGTNGFAEDPTIPSIAGQHIEYLVEAMLTYTSGARTHEAMAAAVKNLSEDDLRNLAGFYTGMELPVGAGAPAGETEATETETIQDPAALGQAASDSCAGCHGADGNSVVDGTPSLAGLSEEYLVSAITAYKTSARAEPMMNAFVAGLPVEDIGHIATFYAAQTPTARDNAAGGDGEAGKAAAKACEGCHGADGNSADPATPSVAGQDALYLAKAIDEYKSGARKHDLMTSVVGALDKSEIANLAIFYTAQTPTATEVAKPLTAAEWAERCDRCHGPDGYSKDPSIPRLAGQHAEYLSTSLHAYQNEERKSSAMHAMSSPMSEWEIEAVSAYYSKK